MASVNPLLPSAIDVVWSVLWLAALMLLVVAVVSLIRSRARLTQGQALGWVALVLLVPVAGPLAWLFVGRRTAIAGEG